MREIVIGCDNAGYEMKKIVIEQLVNMGCPVEDVGCDSASDETLYPHIAGRVCKRVIESGFAKRGVLICGTGIGMCMTANKFRGIRAAVAHDLYSARRSVLSNNGNVLCMGARVIGPELAKMIASEWVRLEFADGPSTPKVEAILQTEAANFH